MNCCSGVRLWSTSWPIDFGFDGIEKAAHDFKVDIGFQEAETHFTQRIIDIIFGDLALTAQPLKGQFKLIG